MEIYIILAISFAVMFSFRYTKDIIFTIREVAKVKDIEENKFLLNLMLVVFFISAALFMPAYLLVITTTERSHLIHQWSTRILIRHYGLVEK